MLTCRKTSFRGQVKEREGVKEKGAGFHCHVIFACVYKIEPKHKKGRA